MEKSIEKQNNSSPKEDVPPGPKSGISSTAAVVDDSLVFVVVVVIDVEFESVADVVVIEGGAAKLLEKAIRLINNNLLHKSRISSLLMLNDPY